MKAVEVLKTPANKFRIFQMAIEYESKRKEKENKRCNGLFFLFRELKIQKKLIDS